MREFKKEIASYGKLEIIGDKTDILENVRCEFSYDIFSSKRIEGFFEIGFLYHDVKEKKFVFTDSVEREIKGIILGFNSHAQGGYHSYLLTFKVDEYNRTQWFSDSKPKKLKIEFLIPYISYLNRKLLNYHYLEKDYLLKFVTEVYKIKINSIDIIFEEYVSFVKNVEPDSMMHRILYPTLHLQLDDSIDIENKIRELRSLLEDVLLVLSVILDNKMRCFGYIINLFGENDKIIVEQEFRSTTISSGKDFVKDHLNHEFEKLFAKDKIVELVNNFVNHKNKELLRDASYDLLTSQELKIFEPQLVWTIFSLEGISKIIADKINDYWIKFEDVVRLACDSNHMNIDLVEYDFLASEIDTKKWLITDFRNNIAHFNNKEFDNDVIYDEYKKVLRLARNLLLKYLDSDKHINDYPFP